MLLDRGREEAAPGAQYSKCEKGIILLFEGYDDYNVLDKLYSYIAFSK
jgi:hypothetical protein